jgi:chorismate mutase / prephenate dehydratase
LADHFSQPTQTFQQEPQAVDLSLEQLRVLIDQVDSQIHDLLNKRAQLASQVASVKLGEITSNQQDQDIIFYRPEREAAVLRKVMSRNKGPLPDEESARIFREIMSACLALEQPLTIAFLGPEGTFTQAAALKHFGHSVKTLPFSSIDQVFRDVDAGTSHYGVVPIENSTEGIISHTLDLFIDSSLKIVGEVSLRIHHHLMSINQDVKTITKIYSHQQSLAQCRKWLDTNLPKIDRIAVNSNTEAAKLAQNDPAAAAIGPSAAAEIYQLQILNTKIEDSPDNTTRFLILGKQDVDATPVLTESSQSNKKSQQLVENKCLDKTSLLVSSKNKPGALYELLKPLARNNISMSRIESRPSQCGIWQYVFFIDIEGHISDPVVKKAVEEISSEVTMIKVLGSYPKAVL